MGTTPTSFTGSNGLVTTGIMDPYGLIANQQKLQAAATPPPAGQPPTDPNNPYMQNVGITSPTNSGGTITSPGNSTQFATDETALARANQLGGSVVGQQLSGPGNSYVGPDGKPINMNMIQTPNGSLLNAGLVNQTFANYGNTGVANYQIASDSGLVPKGMSGTQWELSQPGFTIDPTKGNSGPGYNIVPDGKGGFINMQNGPNSPSMTPAQATQLMQAANGVKPGGGFTPGFQPTTSGAAAAAAYTASIGGTTSPGTTSPGTTSPGTTSPGTTPPVTTKTTTTGSKVTAPAGFTIGPNGTLVRNPATSGTAGNLNQTASSPITGSQVKSIYGGGGSQTTGLNTAGLTVQPDINGAYTGQVTVNGQLQQISVLPDGRIFNGSGQEITSTLSQSDVTSLRQAFGQASGDQTFAQSVGQATGGGSPSTTGSTSGGGGIGSVAPESGTPGGQGFAGSNPYDAPDNGYKGNQSPYQNLQYQGFQGSVNPGSPSSPGLYGFDQAPRFDTNGENVNYQAQNDRNLAVAGGAQLQQNLQNYTNYQQGQAGNYQDQANAAYSGIASGNGGYTQDEQNAILDEPYLQSLQLSNQQAQDNYLSTGEQNAIAGNPQGALDGLNNDISNTDNYYSLNNLNNVWTGNVKSALDQQDQTVQGALGQTADSVRGTYGNTDNNVNGALGNEAAATNPYVDPTALNISDQYKQNYQVSPQDYQNILDSAGRTVGNQEVMDEETLQQQANSAGNTSPLAMAARRDMLRQTGAVNEANAMSDAAIKAKQLQLGTTQNLENTRLGAAQNYANLGVGTQLNLGQQNVAAQQQLGQAALGAEQYLGSQAQQAQQYLGGSRIANTQQLGQQAQNNAEYTASTNLGANQTADQLASTRANTIATNRQATNQSNQASQLQRGQYIYGQNSAANTNFANQKMGQQQEYRGYLTGQQNQANQNVAVGNQQQVGAYGATTGATNNATTNAVNNAKTPDGAFSVVKAITGAKGAVSSGPHVALVGEAGPELIIDLAPDHDSPYGLPHHDDGILASPYGVGDPGDAGAGTPVGDGLPTDDGKTIKRGEDVSKNSNPLYVSILRQMMSQDPNSNQWSAPQQSSDSSSGGGGGILGAVAKFAPLFLAQGGVMGSHPHHFYGSHNKLHEPLGGIHPPRVRLVTKPTITMLGAKVPQAVLPLTPRKSNKVTPEMIPGLLHKFGGYHAGI